jgi:ribosome-binding protein aMBF1 (putative translation factor)
MSEFQDWQTVTVRGRRKPATAAGGAPKQQSASQVQQHRAEREDLPVSSRFLSSETRQQIIAKRVEQKWSQGDLDKQCNFPQHTLREIESGRAVPSPTQLNVLNRVLKTALKFEHRAAAA